MTDKEKWECKVRHAERYAPKVGFNRVEDLTGLDSEIIVVIQKSILAKQVELGLEYRCVVGEFGELCDKAKYIRLLRKEYHTLLICVNEELQERGYCVVWEDNLI